VVSFFVDVIAYALLIHFLSVINLSSIVIASLGARLISAIVNYYINRELVFGQRTKNSMLQYFLLVIVQILLSSFLVYLIYLILPIGDSVLLKIGVDCLLFFFSYHVQKNVIFKE
jgi:putative flippase GtrA